jgi:hypothetical protein
MPQGEMVIRDIIDRMRHDGCGGRAGRAELLTSIRWRQQPPGAADRACWRRRPLTGPSAPWLWCRGTAAASFRARWSVPTIVWRRGGRRDWPRHSQTGALRSAGLGDWPRTANSSASLT